MAKRNDHRNHCCNTNDGQNDEHMGRSSWIQQAGMIPIATVFVSFVISVASAQLYLHSASMPDSPSHRHRYQSHQRQAASNSTNMQYTVTNHTNSTLGNFNMTNTKTNTTTNTSSQPLYNTTTSNYTFCQAPNYDTNAVPSPNSCKAQNRTWNVLHDRNSTNNDTTCSTSRFPNDFLSGECGPHCRPSCITLQLSLKNLQQNYNDMILCSIDDSIQSTSDCSDNYSKKNKCEHTKRQPQPTCDAPTSLYEQYPSCYLEDAKCFGPTLYDDIVALYESRWNNITATATRLPSMEHCAVIPRENPLQERFHDWPLITPRKVHCDDDNDISPCFNSSSGGSDNDMLYFEYCNIMEEDYDSCDACTTGTSSSTSERKKSCRDECSKVIQPFPSGWTTFVVSASIPYNNIDHTMAHASDCDNDVQYANETGVVCFLQRIEVYYPEDCPYCHSCPHNVGLGDTFGPLEVIGFGHVATNSVNQQQQQQHQGCAPCNKASKVKNTETSSISCLQIQQCHESVDCSTGTTLGIPSYKSNQCSFQNPSIQDDDLVQEDSAPSDDDGRFDDDVSNPDTGSDDRVPTNTPATRKPSKKVTAIPTNAPSTSYFPSFAEVSVTLNPTTTTNSTTTTPTETKASNPSPPIMAIDRSSKEFQFSPAIAAFIVIALFIVISIQLIIYRRRVVGTVQQQRNKNSEEILYIEEPLEFDGINKFLSKKEHNGDDNDSQPTVTENENDDNLSQETAAKVSHRGRWGSFRGPNASQHPSVSSICLPSQPEIRHFQTASIVERSDQNEVEALYMTGQHHVQQSPSYSSSK